jgi:hypothetical protein
MILPMTPQLASQTAQQLYMMLYGVEVNEDVFIQAVAPEIYSAAKMENKAVQEITERYESWGAFQQIAQRYETK